MAKPTDNSAVFLDQLILQIRIHLQTVGGVYLTTGTIAPVPTLIPGFKLWTGYSIPDDGKWVEPPTDPQVSQEIDNSVVSVEVELETDPVIINEWNTTRLQGNGSTSAGPGGNGFSPQTTDLKPVKKTTVVKGKGEFPKGTEPSLAKIDFSATWDVIASQYIARKESFTEVATDDQGDPRLGYGTSMLLVKANPWTTRTVKYGDKTTIEDAMLVLQYQVRNTFKYKVVGKARHQMSLETFESLTKTQKAALISFAYNCGSFLNYPEIIDDIKAGNMEEAAVGIENGPSKGAKDGKTYTGLIRRRREEAALFRYK